MKRIALALAALLGLASCSQKSDQTQIYLQRFWGECGAAYGQHRRCKAGARADHHHDYQSFNANNPTFMSNQRRRLPVYAHCRRRSPRAISHLVTRHQAYG